MSELPPPPPGKTGWPWTEESQRLPAEAPDHRAWPGITVVTPSFNQGRFIEETIRSILLQGYPDLEYFVLDGGSADDTVAIIKKYSRWMDFWVSECDGGQSAAINRGLGLGSGFYATWINSDDMLCKDALYNHALMEGFDGNVLYVGDCVHIDEVGKVLQTHRGRVHCLEDLLRVASVWRAGGSIDQPAVLFPLELARRVGGLNETNHYTMDYELWGKFLLAGARICYTGVPFGMFRWHSAQKTQDSTMQTESTLDVAESLLGMADPIPAERKREISAELEAYRQAYPAKVWRQSGRLARAGLPPVVVRPIRKARATVERALENLVKAF
jgi:hypothetical protein